MQAENIMSFNEFKEKIKEAVAAKVTGEVSIQKVQKNNGVELNGLMIITEETNISPMIYLDNYYEYYKENGLDGIVENIIETYRNRKPTKNMEVEFFTDIERVRPKIKMRLINYEKNTELLKNVPHVRYIDLAVVFTVIIQADRNSCDSVLVHNNYLRFWKVDATELYNIAMENTKDDYEMISMASLIEDMPADDSVGVSMDDLEIPMYILTNYSKLYGATGMVHKEILESFMKEMQAQKLVILPSSTHEVILIPCDEIREFSKFSRMVKEVNATQLQPEEILSDNAYLFDGNQIEII